jgi:4Fe-4S binding protein
VRNNEARATGRQARRFLTGGLLVALAVLGIAECAAAHGQHGAAQSLGPTGIVTVDGYQVELLSDPAPLTVGRESRVIAKILRGSLFPLPVTGGDVRIGLAPIGVVPAVVAAPEMTWAGSYTAAFTPRRAAGYQVRVVIERLESRRFDPPLVVTFQVDVERAHVAAWLTWSTIVLAAALGVGAFYALHVRARASSPGPMNLLDIPWLRRTLTSAAFQPMLQFPVLAVMALVVYLGFTDVQDGGVNLATKLTWTIWWAGIIFTFVLAGRVWCIACPFGALNEWASRASRAWRRLPRPFRNIWWATALFVILTWADEQLGVVRSPRVTAWIVVAFAALALVVGVRYERRSFCRYLCPIGGLIGIYSMAAPLELRASNAATCRCHREKTCYRGGASARGCPMLEFPQAMDRNNYCTLCGECVKGCSRDNLALRVRAFGQDLWASGRRVMDEAYLAVALVGLTLLVTAGMLTAWPMWMSALARCLPAILRTSLKPVTYLGAVESLVLLGGSLVAGPLVVLSAAAISERLAGSRALGLRRSFVTFAYMFIPIGLAMHLAHNLSHLLLEGSGIVPVVQRAASLFGPAFLGDPDWTVGPLVPVPVVGLLQTVVVVGFFLLSLVSGHRLAVRVYVDARIAGRALVPFAVLAFVLTAVGIALLNQPMGMRHGMS